MEYPLCDRVVTLYRKEQGEITRTVVEGCYYNWQMNLRQDATGVKPERTFLLVIPQGRGEVRVGDRVVEGIGPPVREVDWPRFVPALVEGLSQVAYVRPWYWEGKLCHVEAGRK